LELSFARGLLTSYANGGPIQWVIGRGESVAQVSLPGIVEFAENEPHNDFIRILHAYGLACLLLYLRLLVVFLREGLRLRGSGVPCQRRLGGILVSSLVGIVILSLTTEPMRYPTGIWYLVALASIVMFQAPDPRELSLPGGSFAAVAPGGSEKDV
jgi:O-antigen ligase